MPRGIGREEYERTFADAAHRALALEHALEIRKFEIELYWQRATYFWTFLDQAAAMIERAHLHREAMQIELLKRTDSLRSALLSSVSHDLRTPLSSIKAAASSLLQEDVQWDDEARRSFLLTIEHEADRLLDRHDAHRARDSGRRRDHPP